MGGGEEETRSRASHRLADLTHLKISVFHSVRVRDSAWSSVSVETSGARAWIIGLWSGWLPPFAADDGCPAPRLRDDLKLVHQSPGPWNAHSHAS
jgi:hypothetical protein